MIWSSRASKLGIALASICAHGIAAYVLYGTPEVRIQGGAEAAVQARLGNSFADLAAGTLAPETPDTLEEVQPTEVAETVTPDTPIEQAEPEQVTEAAQPETTLPTNTVTETQTVHAEATRATRPQETASERPTEQLIAPALPTDATPAATALALAPAVTTPSRADLAAPTPITPLEQATPIKPLTPAPTVSEPEAIEAVQPQQTVIAAAPPPEALQPLPEDGVQVSRRPQVRPQRIEQQAEQRRAQQQQQRQQHATRPTQQGNAQQNAVAGSETGSNQAAATRQSTNTGQSSAAGNAAASNYPGQVMGKISRVPRPRVGSRGTAVVSFTISASGGLSGVSIARSSGSARLDQAAVRVIRRAAPFPRPPAGARRSYQISIEGRG